MKVCMITSSFPRWERDGQGSFILELCRALTERGVLVQVITMHSSGALVHEFIDGIEIYRPKYLWPSCLEALRKDGGGIPATWRRRPWVVWQIFPFIAIQTISLLKHIERFQIIHAHWTLSAMIAILGRMLTRHSIPIVVTVHGSDIFQVTKHPFGRIVTRLILQKCEHIVAVSQALASEVVKLGISWEKLSVISNGVDVQSFQPLSLEKRRNFILFVGSLIERKGVRFLLEAMPSVFEVYPNYELLIAGDGPQDSLLRQVVDSLGIVDKVKFLGFQSHDQVQTLMQEARLLVLPSLEEAQGVVLLEALASGTPVVASSVGGIPEVIINQQVGILVPAADSKTLGEAILEILSDEMKWLNMSRYARLRAEKIYSWKEIAQQTLSVYERVKKL